MNKALFSLAVGATALPLLAQPQIDNCLGPTVIGTPGANTDLSNTAFNVQQVAQVYIIPNPAGGSPKYIGGATVEKIGASDWDPVTFDWNGPGNNPTITTYADTLTGPGDEFQLSLSADGLVAVTDTGPGHSVGNGNPIMATRTSLTSAFGNAVVISGAAGGYIDPQLGTIGGQDVLFWVDSGGGIKVGDLNRTNGAVSNVRDSIFPSTTIPGVQFFHSPTPVWETDANGRPIECVAIISSVFASGTGSDGYYQSSADASQFLAAGARASSSRFGPYPFFNDGSDWNANPACLNGTAYYADASGAYGDPLQIEFFHLTSCSFDTKVNSTVKMVGHVPNDNPNPFVTAVNIGGALLANPIDPNQLGITAYGLLCVDASSGASIATGTTSNNQFTLSFPVAANSFPASGVILAEALALDLVAGEVFVSNVAFIEGR